MKIVFAGTPQFASAILQDLLEQSLSILEVWTQPDRPGKRGKALLASPVKTLAQQHGLAVYQPQKMTDDAVERLHKLQPDLLIVVAYGQILPPAILDIPGKACINVHTSLLPRWRGAAPIQRAIAAGDKVTGVTLIRMDEGLDTGPILDTRPCAINPADSTATLQLRLQTLGTELLLDTVDNIDTRLASAKAQPTTGVSYAKRITRAESHIDWTSSAIQIERNIRMLNPNPVAFTLLDQLRVRIWDASVQIDSESRGRPGEIMSLTKDGLDVSCGTGVLRITRLQVPLGKGKVISALDLVNSRRDLFQAGSQFSRIEQT